MSTSMISILFEPFYKSDEEILILVVAKLYEQEIYTWLSPIKKDDIKQKNTGQIRRPGFKRAYYINHIG